MTITAFEQYLVMRHEGGYRFCVYKDSRGFNTIGVGFNLDDPSAINTCDIHGVSYQGLLGGARLALPVGMQIFNDQLLACEFSARKHFPGWDQLQPDAQSVVIDMIFNMGDPVFSEFHGVISALNQNLPDYAGAAKAMEESKWFGEVGSRATSDRALMLSCIPVQAT